MPTASSRVWIRVTVSIAYGIIASEFELLQSSSDLYPREMPKAQMPFRLQLWLKNYY